MCLWLCVLISRYLYWSHKKLWQYKRYEKLCGKLFCLKKDWDAHMRRHFGDKVYQCNFCGQSFCSTSELSHHLNIHRTENQFSCEVCSKKLSTKRALKVHNRIHTGEKPYQCQYCGSTLGKVMLLPVTYERNTNPNYLKTALFRATKNYFF